MPAVPGGRRAHEIGFTIHGEDLQFVEVELDPGESAVAEAGLDDVHDRRASRWRRCSATAARADGQGGIMGALLGAGKRLVTGESLFMTVFTNRGPGVHRVAFAAPYAGRIVTLDLAKLGGQLICQKDSFLCAARGVSIGIAFQRKIGVGLFGGEGFIMQKLRRRRPLLRPRRGHGARARPRTRARCCASTPAAWSRCSRRSATTSSSWARSRPRSSAARGSSSPRSPGPAACGCSRCPLSRLADRIYKAAPQRRGGRSEEGGILDHLGGLGNVIDGD